MEIIIIHLMHSLMIHKREGDDMKHLVGNNI